MGFPSSTDSDILFHGDRGAINSVCKDQPRSDVLGRNKTRAVWKQFLIYPAMVGVALWAIANAVWAIPMRGYFYLQNKAFYDQVEQAQINALKESLNVDVSLDKLGYTKDEFIGDLDLNTVQQQLLSSRLDPEKMKKISKKAIEIQNKIKKLEKGEFVWGGIEGIKEDLAEVMAMSEYQQLKDYVDYQAINFLQVVAYMLTDANCSQVYEDYGRKCLENQFQGREDITPQELQGAIDGYLRKSPINADHGRFQYAAIFPDRTAVVSITSNLDPEHFDGTRGNSNMRVSSNDAEVRDYDGPNPVGNAVYRHGYLPLCKKLGIKELRIDHLDATKSSEDVWVVELENTAEEYRGVLYYARLGFPPKIALKDAPKPQDMDIESCCRKWASGIHINIPQDVLSPEEKLAAVDKAIGFCRASYPDVKKETLTPKERIEIIREMQAITNGFLINAIRAKYRLETAQGMPEGLHKAFKNSMTKACKECVDRAPSQEAITQEIDAFVLNGRQGQNKKTTYSANEAYAHAGRIFYRSQHINGRSLLKRRYDLAGRVSRSIGRQANSEP